ncbi:MAG: quinone oxidoreductase [Bifidobacteriaceae bacterium]|nr:quinone oxidoreductase [Bifidobacteriaceae bacterium]
MLEIRAARAGGPTVLKPAKAEIPEPGPGQALVKVAAVGVNFIDTYRRSGVYSVPFPHVPGSEGSGWVQQAPPGSDFVEGQRVAWATSATGSYAEYAVVDADRLLAVPESLGLDVAAALPLQGMTADYLVRSAYPVRPGHTVVIYAAAGGVGGLATQMALQAGAHVIATIGGAAKIATVLAFGVKPADVIDLGALADLTEELPREVRARTQDGAGADVVFDGVGRATFQATLASLRPRGAAVLFGGTSGQVPPFDIQELNAHGSLYLTRPKLDDYTATHAELTERAGRVFGEAAAGRLVVGIGGRFALESAAEAHRAIESGQTQGKLLLFPGDSTWAGEPGLA